MQRKSFGHDFIDPCQMDTATDFDQLLRSAAAQPEPQRLLFVFATAALPQDATPVERERFAAGRGGTLSPVVCVDKGLDELSSFEALVTESRTWRESGESGDSGESGSAWHVVFAAGLAGRNGQPPAAEQVERALQLMVERVRGGRTQSFLALDPAGESLQFV